LRQTVRFADGLQQLAGQPSGVLLEVGPGRTLATLSRQHPTIGAERVVACSLDHAKDEPDDVSAMLNALGRLWLAGCTVDWSGFCANERRHRVPLPTYPFERKRYWIEPVPVEAGAGFARTPEPQRSDASDREELAHVIRTKQSSDSGQPAADQDETLTKLKAVFQELSGVDLSRANESASFLELGFDSLFLTQASQEVQKRFGVRVTFRQLLEEFPTLQKLAARLKQKRTGTAHPESSVVAPKETCAQEPAPAAARHSAEDLSRVKSLPLTDAQREIWFATQMGAAASTAYNESCTLHLRGAFEAEAMRRATQQLIERHEALRTTFSPSGEAQRIAASVRIDVPLVDLSNLKDGEREARTNELIDCEAQYQFDLVNGPLLRAQIIRLAEQHHLFVLTAHHLVCDGWARGVLLYELGQLYSANQLGVPASLPPPPQFSDHARRQVARQQTPESAAAEAYWLKQFSDKVPVLELPTDRPRPVKRTYAGGHRTRAFKPEIVSAIKRLSTERDCTTFTLLLSVFNLLLHRLSGQEDIVVGVPAAAQVLDGLPHLVGHCINLLPIRSRIGDGQPLAGFLTASRQAVLNGFDHWQHPIGSLIRKLNLPRDLNRVPLTNVTFNVGRLRGGLRFDGLRAELVNNPKRFVNFDINFNVTESDDALSLDCYYSAELFDAETAERLLERFELLIERLAANPDQAVSTPPLLTGPERHQLLVEWNRTAVDYPREKRIHELFETQAERTPDATAVVFGSERISYHELDQRANHLAQRLRQRGVGPETLVGVCAGRTPAMVAGLLAILKAGGAYVPLDPAYPKERIAFMLEDSRATVLLTQSSLRDNLGPGIADLNVICLDTPADETHNPEHAKAPCPEVTSRNLAYVIYTSGSTGKPKGVAIEHRSAVALIHWALGIYSPEELAGVLAATSICFDLSVFELFVPLSCGGAVVLAENALQLPALAARNEVTLVNTVPSAVSELVRMNGVPPSVRVINLAGEPLSTQLVGQLYRLPSVQKVYDLYGPTEDTTYSTFTLRRPDGRATIGRPIANTQVYILDRHLQPTPRGVPGELCIGGDGLARGYLHRPELTAQRFVCPPFSGDPAARIYRTGDLARFLPDGNLEFLGRMDHQVKVRGYRIELGEIESVLADHPAVRDCVVVAREDTPGEKRLVAYFTTEGKPGVTEIRDYLKRKLPDYMTPAAFVLMEKIPLTPNGKVDRHALPAPENDRHGSEKPCAPPRTTAEEILVDIWRDVLNLGQVGIDDNFFELGGHSLLVMQVLTRVREAFQMDLPMRQFFESPTITELAAVIEDRLILEVQDLAADNSAHPEAVRELAANQ